MGTTSSANEPRDLELSLEERWVLHNALLEYAETLLESDDSIPEWLGSLFDTVENDDPSLTEREAAELATLLESYVNADRTPASDVGTAHRVLERLEALQDSP